MENKIITLSNNEEYMVLKDKTIDGKRYIFCSKYNDVAEVISENTFLVAEVTLNGEDLQINDIEDDNLAERITKIFLEEMKNN